MYTGRFKGHQQALLPNTLDAEIGLKASEWKKYKPVIVKKRFATPHGANMMDLVDTVGFMNWDIEDWTFELCYPEILSGETELIPSNFRTVLETVVRGKASVLNFINGDCYSLHLKSLTRVQTESVMSGAPTKMIVQEGTGDVRLSKVADQEIVITGSALRGYRVITLKKELDGSCSISNKTDEDIPYELKLEHQPVILHGPDNRNAVKDVKRYGVPYYVERRVIERGTLRAGCRQLHGVYEDYRFFITVPIKRRGTGALRPAPDDTSQIIATGMVKKGDFIITTRPEQQGHQIGVFVDSFNSVHLMPEEDVITSRENMQT